MPKDKKPKATISETKATYRARRRLDARKDRPPGDFWNPLTLDELIKKQGTRPLTAADFKKADFWPPDEDFEEFFRAAVGPNYRKK